MPVMYTWKKIEDIKHRMEPDYWNPKYTEVADSLISSGFQIEPLGKYITEITNGSRERAVYVPEGVQYIKAVDILRTGIYYPNLCFVVEGSVVDTPRSRLNVNDLMLVRTGKGSIGKICIWHKEMGKATASQHVNLVRLKGINPYWAAAFLKSKFGQTQIEQLETGVNRMTHLTYDDIKHFRIAIVPNDTQEAVERRYKEMLSFHDAAIEAYQEKSELESREKIQYAEKLLTDLINYVETTINIGKQSGLHSDMGE